VSKQRDQLVDLLARWQESGAVTEHEVMQTIAEYDTLAVTKALPIHAGADGEDYNSKLLDQWR